jgi:hypothetical protein
MRTRFRFEDLGRPRRRWKGHIRMNFKEIGWEGVCNPSQDMDQWRALVNTVMNLRVL